MIRDSGITALFVIALLVLAFIALFRSFGA
jgi:hypothetical protein